MEQLKPCPFCGSESHLIYFKRDTQKVMGVYHEICTIRCKCTCTISRAGFTRDKAEEYAVKAWNRRADDGDNH